MTNAAAVLSLSGEQAGNRLPVSVTGVVTAAEPDWNGQFFVQDATAGVFVENLDRTGPVPGDVVTITGVSHPGAFAPIISEPDWRKTGEAALPGPKRVSIENLMAGVEDSQRVEISGIVRTARIEAARLLLDVAVGGYRLQVHGRVPPDVPPQSLIAARVRVRGTAATHYNTALRHLTSVAVYVPRLEDFTVLESEPTSPFAGEAIPVNSVAQYRHGTAADQRVHVRGRVTYQRIGDEIFLQDESGGLRIQSPQPDTFTLGDEVDAIGFIEYEHHLPLLRDGELRRTGTPNQPVPPRVVPFLEIKRGQHHGDLITLSGRILDRTTRPVTRPAGGFAGFATTWLLQGDELAFTVEHEDVRENPELAAISIGSVVAIDGVCLSTVDASARLESLKLLLPTPTGLRVLARPSWLTPERLLAGIALLSAGLVIVVAWSLTVSNKNAALRRLVRELEQAQRELQDAHDTLEQKVVERSAQLQVEMTARKTAEVQFRAVLAERTRLARDLHDTLEQTLTGIALRLETTTRLAPRDPEAAREHLQFARNLLHQSQVELRRSIWDLRSRELEQFDLANALRHTTEQLVDATEIILEFRTEGTPQRLPEVVEENVLRIGQEALTNIAKHARASHVSVTLQFEPRTLRLRVEDDGVGFDRRTPATPGEHHFGLIGMAERAKRIAGHIQVESVSGSGTTITVEIPLERDVTVPGVPCPEPVERVDPGPASPRPATTGHEPPAAVAPSATATNPSAP